MERLIKVASEGNSLIVDVDGMTKSFSRDRGISAQAFFEALRYQPRDKYTLEKGDSGEIPQDVFDSFCDLVNEVIAGINRLAEQEETKNDQE